MKSKFLLLPVFLLISLSPGQAFPEDHPNQALLNKAVLGLFMHDRGPFSDRHESGTDPGLELQFGRPAAKYWRWLFNPYPIIGLIPNFNGNTSVFYAGLSYEYSLSDLFGEKRSSTVLRNLFIAGGVSLALHDGPLHKEESGCREDSDCGFGYRVLPRLAVELGYRFGGNQGISLFYDHMSHKGILGGENEGIEHLGLRYHWYWDADQ